MKWFLSLLMIISAVFAFTGCSKEGKENVNMSNNDSQITNNGDVVPYVKITPSEAKEMMENEDVIILDVRTEEEYNAGHIKNAVLLPVTEIEDKAQELLPDKEVKILLYCRSGNRTQTASKLLREMGYTQVIDFGGIIDWPYEVVKD